MRSTTRHIVEVIHRVDIDHGLGCAMIPTSGEREHSKLNWSGFLSTYEESYNNSLRNLVSLKTAPKWSGFLFAKFSTYLLQGI